MQQDEGIERIGDRLDERIVGHEPGVRIERLATVVFQQLQIANQMYNQE
jgi:hypothetical protein